MIIERIAKDINCRMKSVRDLRILMIVLLIGNSGDFEQDWSRLKSTKKNRQVDVDRYYKNDEPT